MNENNKEKFKPRDMKTQNKFFVNDLLIDEYAKKLKIYATGVYLCLCRHSNKEQTCYPALSTIAKELGISRSQVVRGVKILKENNLIKVSRYGKKLNNRYFLTDESEWSGRNFTGIPEELHSVSDRNFLSNDTQLNYTQRKEDFSSKDLAEAYKNGNRSYKPFYKGEELRWMGIIWKVIPKEGGSWCEYNDKESKIEWKKVDKYK